MTAAILAQRIRWRLPYCSPRFEYQAQHLSPNFLLRLSSHCDEDKNISNIELIPIEPLDDFWRRGFRSYSWLFNCWLCMLPLVDRGSCLNCPLSLFTPGDKINFASKEVLTHDILQRMQIVTAHHGLSFLNLTSKASN